MHLTTSVVFAGLGGQGVLTAAEILAQAAFHAGCDVKKSEVHGMAQRGGLVVSDVRFGACVLSPMTASAGADCLVLLDASQLDAVHERLRSGGTLLTPEHDDLRQLANRRDLNIALLGILARSLRLAEKHFDIAITQVMKPSLHSACLQIFRHHASSSASTSAQAGISACASCTG